MKRLQISSLTLLCLLFAAPFSSAQEPASWRGAWIADISGERHVLYLVLRNEMVSGFHCFDCANPDNLSFVDDGELDASELHYNLYHSSENATSYIERVEAQIADGELHLKLTKPDSPPTTLLMHRAPPQVVPQPVADARPNQPGPGRARELPGAAETLTADQVLGLWLWGTGPTKQYFIFKRHKNGLRGMVCGPCDSAQDFAPLENISLQGTNFHFEIVHEDNGIGFEENGPFSNVTDAQLALNEMHLTTYASFAPQGRKFEMTLLGPTRYMPPAR